MHGADSSKWNSLRRVDKRCSTNPREPFIGLKIPLITPEGEQIQPESRKSRINHEVVPLCNITYNDESNEGG